jgi:dihydrolipoamide dehydrogenase
MSSSGAPDLQIVPKSLLIGGGGYVGLEMGTVFAELASDVTVVEMTDSGRQRFAC